jgi:hypothetical protein
MDHREAEYGSCLEWRVSTYANRKGALAETDGRGWL